VKYKCVKESGGNYTKRVGKSTEIFGIEGGGLDSSGMLNIICYKYLLKNI
jgi:hypothetical protein